MFTQNHTPTVLDTREFFMFQHFETILPSVESFWSSRQNEVYFMGGGAAGRLWHRQIRSPSWPPSWILPRTIRNHVKSERTVNFFFCFTYKIHLISTLLHFTHRLYFYRWKKIEKTRIFTQKWFDAKSRNHRNWSSLILCQNTCEG